MGKEVGQKVGKEVGKKVGQKVGKEVEKEKGKERTSIQCIDVLLFFSLLFTSSRYSTPNSDEVLII